MTNFTLPERCDRAAAQALLPDLVEALGSGTTTLDGSGVRQIGHAALQLLASARKSHDGLRIIGSDALIEAVRLTGLEQHLFGEAAHDQ